MGEGILHQRLASFDGSPRPKAMVTVGCRATDAVGWEEYEEYILFSLRDVIEFYGFPSVVSIEKITEDRTYPSRFCRLFLEFITEPFLRKSMKRVFHPRPHRHHDVHCKWS